MKVKVKMRLQYEKETIEEEVFGIRKENELFFFTHEKIAMHFYFAQRLFVRDTKESIFSYHFEKNGSLEIYLKEYQKGTRMPLTTKLYRQEDTSLEVIYEIEGNDDTHHLMVEWEMKA